MIGPPYGQGPARRAADREALLALLDLAERLGCGVDLHVDESDRDPGVGVDLVARVALAQRRAVAITCSHASSMGLLPPRACDQLAERLAAAEIAVVALPTTNFWLLGRRPGRTPGADRWRRSAACSGQGCGWPSAATTCRIPGIRAAISIQLSCCAGRRRSAS